MGWRDRDYARWTDEERRRFLGSSASAPAVGSGARFRVAHGAGLAILLSATLLVLGQLPRHHPLIPSLHIRLPDAGTGSPTQPPSGSFGVSKPHIWRLHGPRTGRVGGSLDLRGSFPGAHGSVTVAGTYGRAWRTLSVVLLDDNGAYSTRIALTRRGLLHLRVLYPDGSRAVGSIRIR